MKTLKHIKFLFQINKRSLVDLFSGLFPPILLFFSFLILRYSTLEAENKVLYDISMTLIAVVINLSEIMFAFSILKENVFCLFRLLGFGFSDILLYVWIRNSLYVIITATITTEVVNNFKNFIDFKLFFILWLILLTGTTTGIYYLFGWKQVHIRMNTHKNNRRRGCELFRVRKKYVASLVALFIGSENKITLWLDHIIIWIVIIGGNIIDAPPSVIIYIIYALLLCLIFDMAVSDENNYTLNKLLKRSIWMLKKEKLRFCAMFAVIYTVVTIVVALFCGTSVREIGALISYSVILFVYFSPIAFSDTEIIYDRYTNIKSSSNFMGMMLIMFVMPGVGFIASIIVIVKGASKYVFRQ